MEIFLLFLVVLVAGLFFTFRLRGEALKNALKLYLIGTVLALGGCLGSLGWLGAETSGNSSIFQAVNPFVWAGMFIFGIVVLGFNAIRIISERLKAGNEKQGDQVRPDDSTG